MPPKPVASRISFGAWYRARVTTGPEKNMSRGHGGLFQYWSSRNGAAIDERTLRPVDANFTLALGRPPVDLPPRLEGRSHRLELNLDTGYSL